MQRLLKIKTINGYRCFSPLVWDENDAELFDKYNLIYGWNGSGKSTLGSFFHQLEKKALECVSKCKSAGIMQEEYGYKPDERRQGNGKRAYQSEWQPFGTL